MIIRQEVVQPFFYRILIIKYEKNDDSRLVSVLMVTIWGCDEAWCVDVKMCWYADVMSADVMGAGVMSASVMSADVIMWWWDECWFDECTGRVKEVCLVELYSASWRAEPWGYFSNLCDFNNFSNYDQKQNLFLLFVNSPVFQFMIKFLTHHTDHQGIENKNDKFENKKNKSENKKNKFENKKNENKKNKIENKNKSPPPLLPHHYPCHHGAPDRLFSLFAEKMKKWYSLIVEGWLSWLGVNLLKGWSDKWWKSSCGQVLWRMMRVIANRWQLTVQIWKFWHFENLTNLNFFTFWILWHFEYFKRFENLKKKTMRVIANRCQLAVLIWKFWWQKIWTFWHFENFEKKDAPNCK